SDWLCSYLAAHAGRTQERLAIAWGTVRPAAVYQPERLRMRIRSVFAGVLAVALSGAAGAQVGRGTAIPIPFRTYIAFDPLLVPFDIGSFEIESGIAPGITAGAVGSYTNVDNYRYTSADFNLRYYPGEVVLRGFSVGVSGGFLRYSTRVGPMNDRQAVDA